MVPPMEGPTEAGAGAEPAAGLGTGSQPGSGTEAAALSPDPRAPPAAHAAPSSTMQPSPAPDAPPDQQHTAQSSVPGDSAEALRLAHLPDLVLGDLDSLRPDVRQFYVRHSVPFLDLSYDQDTTDLTKAVQVLEERFIRGAGHPEDHEILVLGEWRGGAGEGSTRQLAALVYQYLLRWHYTSCGSWTLACSLVLALGAPYAPAKSDAAGGDTAGTSPLHLYTRPSSTRRPVPRHPPT